MTPNSRTHSLPFEEKPLLKFAFCPHCQQPSFHFSLTRIAFHVIPKPITVKRNETNGLLKLGQSGLVPVAGGWVSLDICWLPRSSPPSPLAGKLHFAMHFLWLCPQAWNKWIGRGKEKSNGNSPHIMETPSFSGQRKGLSFSFSCLPGYCFHLQYCHEIA